jgi:hypothetical protein
MRRRVDLKQSRCTLCGEKGFLLKDKDVISNIKKKVGLISLI